MAFAIETFRDVSPRERRAGQKGASRLATVGTVTIGAGVVAFAWVAAIAFTLQSVVGTPAPGAALLQRTAPAGVDPAQTIGHASLRLAAVLNPAASNAIALANARRSAAAAQIAALAPGNYSTVIAKGDRLTPALTDVADVKTPTGSTILPKSSRPLPQDVMAALKLALNAMPAQTALQTASIDLKRDAAPTEKTLSAAPDAATHDDRLALADASPAIDGTAITAAAQASGPSTNAVANRMDDLAPGRTIPTPTANPIAATAAERSVQVAMIDPTPAANSAALTAASVQRPQTPARPARPAASAARTVTPQPRPEDSNDALPSSAAAMVEPEDRRATVAVEQTFGLVMPTASGDAAGNASADDMLMSSIPLPTMRPAPLADAATTPAAKLTRPSRALLAYARPDDAGEDNAPVFRAPTSLPNARTRVAIYDISAARVYLPSGEQLEAHSGMGGMIDNPRYVNQKNRGPTPPHTYDLTLRESLFHGVQALRLNPVNASAIYGRDGLLAHTYMLGRRGDSNGCVVFKDYNRFLAAFRRGDVNRLVVVPHLSVAPGRIASR